MQFSTIVSLSNAEKTKVIKIDDNSGNQSHYTG